MAGKPFRYNEMIEEALRGVVRRVLRQVAENGFPGAHHFFITFKTTVPGVEVSDYLRERYPDEMTVVLQFEFFNLEVDDDGFAVSLSFNDIMERLVVPFSAITAFADPAAKFGYQFQLATGAASAEVPVRSAPAKRLGGAPPPPALIKDAPALVKEAPALPADAPAKPAIGAGSGDKIVTLDSFRRK
jgi:hypothetical protein